MDNRRMGLKAARMTGRLVDPHRLTAFVKYAFISRVISDLGISLILDVGANRGQFAQSMRDIGYQGTILSFEPVAEQFDALQQAAQGDEKWRVFNVAAGDVNGARTINVMRSSVFSSFNRPSVESTAAFGADNEVVGQREVGVRRLDGLIDELGLSGSLNRTLLKSDTQGHEPNVFRGMGEKLRSVRAVLTEISSIPVYENTPDMLEIVSFLKENGFFPVSFFPVNRDADWQAIEFDYLCVNRALARAA